ncbi:unnamed protein product (macronuclear) [Paramecium tetraurelia]|uniref:Transmembrane protein n=1 Tax=Paramecium tetraurelia TaxID=5888 RepID=A0DSS0_PARTE|nr:uncharacterized protein GSPATT00019780001 [Paramecium tetraurelia]CAK86087.1 unnamed protein product [Paramecium tetraurelia]|eukprot:XP_001453484.1 hypothetical protein (macronuclear) [Paramecium tetraurelia strain d4-2]
MLKFQKPQTCTKHLTTQVIERFDFFGILPQFRILKRQKFSTPLGQILTILICFAYLYYIAHELLDLSNRDNPRVVFSELQPSNTSPLYFGNNNFTFVLTIANPQLSSLQTLNKYFTLNVQNCLRNRYLNAEGVSQIDYNCSNIPLEPCQMEKHFSSQYQQDYFQKFKLQYMYCPSIDYWQQYPLQLQGYSQEDRFQFLTVTFSICKNTTNYQGCAPLEEINSQMQTGFFVMYLSDTLIQMHSPSKPYEDVISIQYSPFSLTNSKSIHSTFKVTETTTDYGILQTDNLLDTAIMQSTIKEDNVPYNQQYLVQNSIFLEQRRNQYQRSYLKLYTLLGQIGGLWQITIIFFNCLFYPVLFSSMNLAMANKIFRFESKESLDLDILSVAKSVPIGNQLNKSDVKDYPGDVQKSENIQIRKSFAEFSKTQQEIKKFLRKKKSSLNFTLIDNLKFLLGFKKDKQRQLKYAMNKIINKLDICQLITKFNELDKLKHILLNKDQLALFNYIPKPMIPYDMFDDNFEKKIKELEQKQEYKFILENEKPDVLRLDDAYEAYSKLIKKQELTQTDEAILQFMDDDIKRLFSRIYSNQLEMLCQNLQSSQIFMKNNTERVDIQDEPHIQLVFGSITSRQY